MTVILDSNGKTIAVGARVIENGVEVGTVTELTDPDGDVNDYGRPVAIPAYVVVHYDDGMTERYPSRWNATGPWDDTREDHTCDDVTIVNNPPYA